MVQLSHNGTVEARKPGHFLKDAKVPRFASFYCIPGNKEIIIVYVCHVIIVYEFVICVQFTLLNNRQQRTNNTLL